MGLFRGLRVCVRMWWVVLLFTAGWVPPSQAYEYEHYALTYLMAVELGFTERQAFQIASAAFAIDWADATGPMPNTWQDKLSGLAGAADETLFRRKWREFHAFFSLDSMRAAVAAGKSPAEVDQILTAERRAIEDKLWKLGIAQQNIGSFMHFVQDEYAHAGWADMFGHGAASHVPDYVSADPPAFMAAAAKTAETLVEFWKAMCESGTKAYCSRPIAGGADIGRMENDLNRFIFANPLPVEIDDLVGLMANLKAFSLTFERVPYKYPTNVGWIYGGLRLYLFQAGVSEAPLDWLTEMPSPDFPRSHAALLAFIHNDQIAARSGRAHKARGFTQFGSWDAFPNFNPDPPYQWIQYKYDRDARMLDSAELIALEDPKAVISNDKVSVEKVGDFDEAVYKVTVSFDIQVDGLAPLNFIPQLPVATHSKPESADDQYAGSERLFASMVGRGETKHYSETREFSVKDHRNEQFNWKLDVDIYSLPQQTLTFRISLGDETGGAAKCNSAVQQGGDEGGSVTVDLGGYTGKAGFTWDMYSIKDNMVVTVGGQTLTTGCVSGSGTFAIDIPAGASEAKVKVLPNCEQTSGTAWTLKFECPLESEVTADGHGELIDKTGGATGGKATGPGKTPTGIPTGAGAASPFSGASGSTTGMVQPSPGGSAADAEPNSTVELANAIGLPSLINGLIDAVGDVDIYLLDAPQAGELTLGSPLASLGYGLYPAGGGNWLLDNTPPDDNALVLDLPAAGKYVLEVRDASQQARLAYSLAASFKPSPDQHEPNDVDAIAVPSPMDGSLVGSIGRAGDADFFKVTAATAGQWTIATTALPDGLVLVPGVYPAPGGNWLLDLSPPDDGLLVVDIPVPGDYVLRVIEAAGKRSPDPYVLGLSFVASTDVNEPNNDPAIATETTADGRIGGTILGAGDQDFFIAELPDQGEWTLAVTTAPPGLKIGLGVYPAGGGNWLIDLSPPDDGKLVVDVPSPGKYLLRVIDDTGARSVDPYELSLAFAPTGDTHEPSNVPATARPISAVGAISGTILPAGDQDFYLFEVPDGGEWTIALDQPPSGITPSFGVYPAGGGNWFIDLSPPDDGRLTIDLPAAGRYILQIGDAVGGRSLTPYQATTSFTPTGDRGEPNSASVLATPIAGGGTISGAILPAGDVDFYIFDAPGGGSFSAAIASQPAGIQLDLGIYPATGGNWLIDKTPPDDNQIAVDLPLPGRYVLRISDRTGARSPQRYEVVTGLQ